MLLKDHCHVDNDQATLQHDNDMNGQVQVALPRNLANQMAQGEANNNANNELTNDPIVDSDADEVAGAPPRRVLHLNDP